MPWLLEIWLLSRVADARLQRNHDARFTGFHSHACHRCGAEWSHPDDVVKAPPEVFDLLHTCPRCGASETEIHQRNVTRPGH